MVHSTATGQGAVIVGNVSVFHNRLAMHRSLLRMASSGMGSCWPQPRQQILYANRGSGQRRTYIIHSLRLTYNRHSLWRHSHFSIFVMLQRKYDKLISPARHTDRTQHWQDFRFASSSAQANALVGDFKLAIYIARRANEKCVHGTGESNLSFQHFEWCVIEANKQSCRDSSDGRACSVATRFHRPMTSFTRRPVAIIICLIGSRDTRTHSHSLSLVRNSDSEPA